MHESEIKSIVISVIKNIAPDTEPDKLQPDDNIRTKLEIDSFDTLQIVVALDEKFGIEKSEADYGQIQTLNSLTDYLIRFITKKVQGEKEKHEIFFTRMKNMLAYGNQNAALLTY